MGIRFSLRFQEIMLDCLLAISHIFIRNLVDINWSKIKENDVSDAFSGLLSTRNPPNFSGAAPQTPDTARSVALCTISRADRYIHSQIILH